MRNVHTLSETATGDFDSLVPRLISQAFIACSMGDKPGNEAMFLSTSSTVLLLRFFEGWVRF